MKKKLKFNILYIFLFILVIVLLYFVLTTFFTSTLRFKDFFVSTVTSKNNDSIIAYTIDENKDVYYAINDHGILKINYLNKEDGDPKTLYTNDVSETLLVSNISKFNNQFYIETSNPKNLYSINLDTKKTSIINKEINYQYLINNFDYNIYLLDNENKILSNYQKTLNYQININENINTIKFIDTSKIYVITYQNKIYYYDLITNENLLVTTNNFINYIVFEHDLYYTYNNQNKLGIVKVNYQNIISDFTIKRFAATSILYCDDYLYLINKEQMIKVSLVRQKKNETYQISNYANMSYDLNNIMIASNDLMYLPMIEYVNETYSYHLKKYQV